MKNITGKAEKTERTVNFEEIENWEQSLIHCRKTKCRQYFFSNWKRFPSASIRKKIGWLYSDYCYIVNQNKRVKVQIKLYGSDISKQYGISRFRQFREQLYFVFFVSTTLDYYRKYLLFKPDRWKRVKEFIYEDFEQQRSLRNYTFSEETDILENKLKFYEHCLKHNIFTPEILAVYSNRQEILNGHSSFSLPEKDLFVKELQGIHGKGVIRFQFIEDKYVEDTGKKFSVAELKEYFANKSKIDNDFIIQPVLKNHKAWQGFTSGALSTCRVVSARTPEGAILPIVASLRMPTGSAAADNYSAGGIASPIDLNTGILGTAVSMLPRNGRFEFETHPDTGQKLTGTQMPLWNELLEFVNKVHNTFNIIFIGWDIALTTQGFVVIEGNTVWGLDVVESPQNRSLLETQYPHIFDKWVQILKSNKTKI